MRKELSTLDYIAGYETWLTREKRAAANTLSSYVRDVRQFAYWADENRLELLQTSQEDVKRYARHLEFPLNSYSR